MGAARVFINALISPPDDVKRKTKWYYLFVLPFCLLAIMHLFFYYIFHSFEMDKVYFSDRFQEIDIKIVRGPTVKNQFIGYGPVNYYIDVEYEYQYLGNKYTGDRVSFGSIRPKHFYNSRYKNEMEKVKNYIVRNKIGYVDPNDPSYSILIPKNIYEKTHKVKSQWYGMEFAGMCVAVTSGIMLYLILCYQYICRKSKMKINALLVIIPILVWPSIIYIGVYFLVMR